jgi:hypothetical protein
LNELLGATQCTQEGTLSVSTPPRNGYHATKLAELPQERKEGLDLGLSPSRSHPVIEREAAAINEDAQIWD